MSEMYDESFVRWVREESDRIAEEWPMGSINERKLIEYWRTNRPKMVAGLEQHGAIEKLAHVLESRRAAAVREYIKAGMSPTDAREQAEKDWLLREPEESDSAAGHDQ